MGHGDRDYRGSGNDSGFQTVRTLPSGRGRLGYLKSPFFFGNWHSAGMHAGAQCGSRLVCSSKVWFEPCVGAIRELILASQHKNPPRESTDEPSEVLPETTNLPAVPDDHVDAWGFAPDGPQNAREIASETGVAKQWTIVAGLLVAALITVSAISLRGEPMQTMRRSFEALGLMRSRPLVQHSSAVGPRVFTEAEVRAPASKSDEVRVIRAPRANERPNPATDDRSTPILVETRDVTAPLTWPIVMSPDTLEGVEEPSGGVTMPAQLLSGGVPEYSALLRTAGIGGSVEVRFSIASNGEVLDVRSTTGPAQLRSIAEAAVRRWRYQAARVGDRPVETQTSVYFYFDPSAKIAPQ